MDIKLPINILGVMSGTSLDGLDLALCRFYEENHTIKYEILEAQTVQYSLEWKQKLQNLTKATTLEFIATDIHYGKLIGEKINDFNKHNNHTIDYISSHGHTIFHEPEAGFSTQIGNGNTISAVTNIPTIYDFRQLDVQLGGTGAPLVPVGDRDLFPNSICINLGGICNLSYFSDDNMIAYDVAPFNIPLNYIAKKLGANYDNNGIWARSGSLIEPLLNTLNEIEYYSKSYPKSLDKSWVESTYFSKIDIALNQFPEADILHTLIQHYIAQFKPVLKEVESKHPNYSILLTGGGAYHQFFVEELQKATHLKIESVSNEIIEFKEALIFAYLGLLRLQKKPNCLSSVTGASKDVCGGVISYNI